MCQTQSFLSQFFEFLKLKPTTLAKTESFYEHPSWPAIRKEKSRLEVYAEEQSGLHLACHNVYKEKWKMEEGDKGRLY